MNVRFHVAFERDLRSLKLGSGDARRVKQRIEEIIAARGWREVSGVRKLAGGGNYYRIRVGTCRLGAVASGADVALVRILHRRDFYRFFPPRR